MFTYNSNKCSKLMIVALYVSMRNIIKVYNFALMVSHCFDFHFPTPWSHRTSFNSLLAFGEQRV